MKDIDVWLFIVSLPTGSDMVLTVNFRISGIEARLNMLETTLHIA